MTYIPNILGFALLLGVFVTSGFRPLKNQKVLLALVDGMRWDSFGLDLPSLRRIEENGVRADWMNGVFVTYTTPNLYSIATGLYPENHGVIHNLFFNATSRTSTSDFEDVLNTTAFFDTGVEPMWISAKLAGKKVAGIMYAGTAVPIKGILSDRVVYLSPWSLKNYSLKDRLKDAVSWIAEEDFDLVLTYLNLPDYTLHDHRIETETSQSDMLTADNAISSLLDDVDQRELWDTLNVIVVSDHGHFNVDPEKYIVLTDYIDEEDIEYSVMYGSALFQLKPKEEEKDKVVQLLQSAHPALHVYRKEDFPEHFHYGNHPRNLPVIGYVDLGWHVHMEAFDPFRDSLISQSDHGYDNQYMEMKPIFYARGPAFKTSYRARPINNVDIYQMVCEILDVEAAPNNGSLGRYKNMMKTSSSQEKILRSDILIIASCLIIAVGCLFISRVFPTKKDTTNKRE
ncbi:Ectonucleotide pyrophosphatase/phosphodiesterase family member 7 [Holothuria leucospilota]|uniref:Ectonucleotide pyrophosphatase/phosphodiesterase family member 7 n=1 Tax=Holothuria leucospilota TaxID=206669 RepID=A0A9Q1C177_HOLLE|nr:Ectonucleotide pyrophosphatase/phosphodiesterase family member 7 [Holothuria leucospilota]